MVPPLRCCSARSRQAVTSASMPPAPSPSPPSLRSPRQGRKGLGYGRKTASGSAWCPGVDVYARDAHRNAYAAVIAVLERDDGAPTGSVPACPQCDVVGIGTGVAQIHAALAAPGDQREQILGEANRIGMDGGQTTRTGCGAHRAAHRLDHRGMAVPQPRRRPGGRQVEQLASVRRDQGRAVTGYHLEREEAQLLDPGDRRLVALVERAHSACTGGVFANSAANDSPTRFAIPEAAMAITNPIAHQYNPSSGASNQVVRTLDVEPQHHRDHHRSNSRQHQPEHLALAAVHVGKLGSAYEPHCSHLDEQIAHHQAHRTRDGEQEVGVDRIVAGTHVGPACGAADEDDHQRDSDHEPGRAAWATSALVDVRQRLRAEPIAPERVEHPTGRRRAGQVAAERRHYRGEDDQQAEPLTDVATAQVSQRVSGILEGIEPGLVGSETDDLRRTSRRRTARRSGSAFRPAPAGCCGRDRRSPRPSTRTPRSLPRTGRPRPRR